MKSRAFTLIELLVVVLIIGILAAIALPQYQAAVDKTRLSTLIPAVRYVKTQQEAFYLENGNYASNCEELGIDLIPGTFFNTNHFLESTKGDFIIRCTATKSTGILINSSKSNLAAYEQTYDKTNYSGKITCWSNDAERYKKLCSSLCGRAVKQQINANGKANGFGCEVQ